MTGDRAMRVAVAAGKQVAENNPALAAAQRKAWARFIRIVWAGGARIPDRSISEKERT
jgi:hypothetical protein